MPYDFPASPTVDQVYTPPGGSSYKWNGYGWSQFTGGAGGGIADAPDAQSYVRTLGAWVLGYTKAAIDALLGTKLDASVYTAADVLTKIKTVDGTTSGLDADLLDGNDSAFFATATSLAGKEPTIAAGTAAQYWQGTKTWQTLDKAAVGLANVDNTSDASKPVSTAQATADGLRVLKAGDTMTGTLSIVPPSGGAVVNMASVTGNNALYFNKTADVNASFIDVFKASLSRWRIMLSNADAAGDFFIQRFDDAGASAGVPLTITRSTGNVGIPVATTTTKTAGDSTTAIATTAFVTTADALALPKAGGTMTGDLTISKATPSLIIDKAAAGQEAAIFLTKGALNRWRIMSDSVAEGGANAGSNFSISSYGDGGGLIGAAFSIVRSSNLAQFSGAMTVTSFLSGSNIITARAATAIPAGGTSGLLVSSTANFGVFFGSGAPTVSAAKGSLYLRSDGTSNVTRMYVNTDGAATWTAVNTVA